MRSDSPSSPADSPGRSSAIGATARRPRAAPHRSRKRWKPLARLADRPANGTAGDVAKPRGGSNRRLLRGCGPSNWSQDRQIPEEFRAPRRSRLRLPTSERVHPPPSERLLYGLSQSAWRGLAWRCHALPSGPASTRRSHLPSHGPAISAHPYLHPRCTCLGSAGSKRGSLQREGAIAVPRPRVGAPRQRSRRYPDAPILAASSGGRST